MADKATLLYAGIFLDGPSRLQLLNLAPPKHTVLSANHLTLIHRPCLSDLQKLPLGRIESLHVTATLSTSCIQAVSIHCADWAFKVIKHAHGGHPHVTVSTLAGVKAKTAGDVVRHFKQGHAHGVDHVLCQPWIRLTGVVGVQLSSGSIATTQSDVVAAMNGSLKPGIPSNTVHINAGASDRPPLMCAAFHGHLQAVTHLLAQGADVSAKSRKGSDALMSACNRGHVNIVKALLAKGASVTKANRYGRTCLMYAASNGHLDVATILLANGADSTAQDHKGWTPLMSASHQGHATVVKMLLLKGSDSRVQDAEGHTALHLAAYNGCLEVVRVLLDHGADLARKSHKGSTALMSACAKGNTAVVTLILSRGADITAKNNKGRTALHTASHKGHSGVVQALVSAGAKK